jgi:hypothetical protein
MATLATLSSTLRLIATTCNIGRRYRRLRTAAIYNITAADDFKPRAGVTPCSTLHDLADCRRRERGLEVAVPIDPPKDAPLDDLGALEPGLQSAKRAGRLIE